MNENEQNIYDAAQRVISELKREIMVHRIYILHLEDQLEPNVVNEIREHCMHDHSKYIEYIEEA